MNAHVERTNGGMQKMFTAYHEDLCLHIYLFNGRLLMSSCSMRTGTSFLDQYCIPDSKIPLRAF